MSAAASAVQCVAGVAADPRQTLGRWGEEVAWQALAGRGYALLARRYRTRLGEIDIVCRQGSTVVFVEVKARSSRLFGSGAAAVTVWKQRRLVRMAEDYLLRAGLCGCPCRFDVVEIQVDSQGVRVTVVPNAFQAPTSLYD